MGAQPSHTLTDFGRGNDAYTLGSMHVRHAPSATCLALLGLAGITLLAAGAQAQASRLLGAPTGQATAPAATGSAAQPTYAQPGYRPPLQVAELEPVRRSRGYMPQWAILAPGLAAFASTYGSSVAAALTVDLSYRGGGSVASWLYAPVVGPWVVAAAARGNAGAQAIFALLGIFEAAGLACIIIGLAINRHAGPAQPMARIAPIPLPGGAGLGAMGRF